MFYIGNVMIATQDYSDDLMMISWILNDIVKMILDEKILKYIKKKYFGNSTFVIENYFLRSHGVKKVREIYKNGMILKII